MLHGVVFLRVLNSASAPKNEIQFRQYQTIRTKVNFQQKYINIIPKYILIISRFFWGRGKTVMSLIW